MTPSTLVDDRTEGFQRPNARSRQRGRAFSLLELAAVVAILGLIAGMAITRFGGDAISVIDAEGVSRRLSMALRLARRQAISEGVDAAVVINRDAGAVSSFTVVRAASGGNEPVEAVISVPTGVTVTTAADRWTYDFTGTLTSPAGGALSVSSPGWTWTITVNAVTGQPTIGRVAS